MALLAMNMARDYFNVCSYSEDVNASGAVNRKAI